MSAVADRLRIDLRCPLDPRVLLARVRASGEKPSYSSDNLVELYCRDCSRYRADDPLLGLEPAAGKVRILHLFNPLGEFVRSEQEAVAR